MWERTPVCADSCGCCAYLRRSADQEWLGEHVKKCSRRAAGPGIEMARALKCSTDQRQRAGARAQLPISSHNRPAMDFVNRVLNRRRHSVAGPGAHDCFLETFEGIFHQLSEQMCTRGSATVEVLTHVKRCLLAADPGARRRSCIGIFF